MSFKKIQLHIQTALVVAHRPRWGPEWTAVHCCNNLECSPLTVFGILESVFLMDACGLHCERQMASRQPTAADFDI